MYKVLIIDDNHSFIDSLKLSLREFHLHMESSYKFEAARKILLKGGPYLNRQVLGQLLDYKEAMDSHAKAAKENARSKSAEEDESPLPEPEKIKIKAPPFQSKGYALVIVEYDTETGTKGTQFIQDLIQHQKGWTDDDFILLTSNISKVESSIKRLNIPTFEKPLKLAALKALIQKKVQKWNQLEQVVSDISDIYQISLEPQAPKKTRVRKKATSDTNSPDTSDPETESPKPKTKAKAKAAPKSASTKSKKVKSK